MLSSTEKTGDFSEDCLRALARVPQLPVFLSSAREPKAMVGGVVYFGYFLLDKQKKVTCRRATPTLNYSLINNFSNLDSIGKLKGFDTAINFPSLALVIVTK